MNQTEHYELNQWDPVDRILREDFNADNAKLDAALAGKAPAWEKFDSFHENRFHAPTILYLPRDLDIDWGKWDYVLLTAELTPQTEDSNATFNLMFLPEDGYTLKIPFSSVLIFFAPHHNPDSTVSGLVLGSTVSFFRREITYREIEAIWLEKSIPGSGVRSLQPRVTCYGVK